MAFASYTCVDDVVKKHKLTFTQAPVLVPAADAPPFNDYFRGELDFNLRKLPVGRSEVGAGEVLLFPILREVWKPYSDDLALFTHEPLAFDDDLCGVPDYFVCKVSEYGQTIPDVPLLVVIGTERDDFRRGWGECLAAMLAAQRLGRTPGRPVFGIVASSRQWEFGRLLGREVTADPRAVAGIDLLGQVLHAVFRSCRDLIAAPPTPAAA